MAWMIGNEGIGIERLPGRKSMSLNLYTPGKIEVLTYFRSDAHATETERWIQKLVKGALMPAEATVTRGT